MPILIALIEHGFTSAPTQYRLYGETEPVSCSNDCATTESYTTVLL